MTSHIRKGLKEVEINPASKLALCCNVVLLYFILENPREISYWNKKILKMLPTSYRQDVQNLALIIDVILMFEKDAYLPDTSPYKLAVSYFYRKQKLQKESFEKICLRALNKISNAASADRKDAFQNFKDQLEAIKASKAPGSIPTGLDLFIYWTESKISKKPLAEIIKNDLKKSNSKHFN